jgi:surface polysaccharide O-acyltransferase-like enzyme
VVVSGRFAGLTEEGRVIAERAGIGGAASRKLHLELLRGLAIILVVYNHTGARGFLLFTAAHNRSLYVVYLFLSIACKIAVPLFFMVSGALLLPKDESLGSLYRRRVLRFTIVIVLFSLAQYVYTAYRFGAAFSLRGFFSALYSSQVIVPYYFLYLYLAILVMLPFLRRLARNMSNQEFLYLGALQVFLVGLVPIFEYLAGAKPLNMDIVFVTMNVFFFVMGYFLEHRVGEAYFRRKYALVAASAGLAAIAVSGFMTWLKAHQTGDVSADASQTFHYGLIAIPTFVTFYLARYLALRVQFPKVAVTAAVWFGGTAFGIYLLERILRVEFDGVYTHLRPHIHGFPAAVVWVLAIVAGGAAATALLKLVPVLRRIL